ncbi:MAG: glycosyltransferase [Thermoanaerobaculia bacterium]|nr:glycosyltransferase [Thermoanaerobaculia bacterium]
MSSDRIKEAGPGPAVVLLARSLSAGGTERQLVNLAIGLKRNAVDVSVVVFYEGGALDEELRDAGVPLRTAGKTGRWDTLRFARELSSRVAEGNAKVIYSFLEVPNVVAAAGRVGLWRLPVVWGIRSSRMDLDRYGLLHRLIYFAQAPLSRSVDSIIFNSEAGRRRARDLGIVASRNRVIPNGIDVERFRFDPRARASLRRSWGVRDDEPLAGIVARLDPVKNHELFVRASALVGAADARVRFVSIGGGDPERAAMLRELADARGLSSRMIWAGERLDLPSVYSALDLNVLSSTGEGFPNAIAESMACETPVVATDVGDAREIVGDTGRIVDASRPEALADAMLEMVRGGGARSATARERIASRYSIERMISSTCEELRAVAGGGK